MNTKLVTIKSVERLNNSVNGNPRYKLSTLEGDFTTQSDNGFVYTGVCDKLERGDTALLTLTPSQRVTDIKVIEEA